MSKPMMYKKAGTDPMLMRIMQEINKSVQTPDKGFQTVEVWMSRWKCQHVTAGVYIRQAIKAGIMEMRLFRVSCKGRIRMTKHYGPAKKNLSPRPKSG